MVNLIDHGPIYMLTSLLEFGPVKSKNKYYRKWWDTKFKDWSSLLDIIIWLDAPNSILVKRINTRDTWHVIRKKSEEEMHNFLIRYRNSLEKVISLSKSHNDKLSVLKYDTGLETPEQIIDTILHECGLN
jgi:hypothetical protein